MHMNQRLVNLSYKLGFSFETELREQEYGMHFQTNLRSHLGEEAMGAAFYCNDRFKVQASHILFSAERRVQHIATDLASAM